MFKSWKTTLAGLGSLATGLYLIATGNIVDGVPAIIAGIGFLVAKDFNTTGNGK